MISTISYYFDKYFAIVCCSIAYTVVLTTLGLIALHLEDWTMYLTIPVFILITYLFIDLANDELDYIKEY